MKERHPLREYQKQAVDALEKGEGIVEVGDQVNCDICNDYFPPSDTRSGGFLFDTYSYCPKCAASSLERIKGYKEDKYIRAWCPEGMSFHDFVMALRGGNNRVVVTSKKK